ncbi:MAG: PD-(D/E)XK nuclease family protein [Treponema sp.]|jgi:CRISPR/Cas system-associated exonuclease Cas4 (RecB family)|nr:PD-(D/E)XK nuclease family protein [Treponema sp.]
MVPVFDVISRYIKDNNVYFVFPSEITAALWARNICVSGGEPGRPDPLRPDPGRPDPARTGSGVRSVAANRFMAWDRFKEIVVRAESRDKKPVSATLRKVFARGLVRENGVSPFLQTVIPPDYADNGEAFVRFITSALPALASWEKSLGNLRPDGEDRDLFMIKTRYASFLERLGLFEPSWEKPPFDGGGKRYIVFFPETLEDFPEYREIVSCPEVTLVHPDDTGEKFGIETRNGTAEDMPELRFFATAREEIREAVIAIRGLHEKNGIPYSGMALSLPDFERVAPYLTRELSLCDVPYVLRTGKCLNDYGTGRLFSLIRECAVSAFSFDSVKALVLNAFIPWKYPELNRDLINFGIRNHCVSPFSEKKRGTVDVWEEAFKNSGGTELKNHYGLFKRHVSALSESKTFAQIRERYFGFRGLLDMEKCPAENDAVLARCVEELSVLIEMEEEYPGVLPASGLPDDDPYGFYVSHLKEKKYVPVRKNGGINIYEYPVAAGAPFACSFVLNAGQSAATVQYQPLRFLRQDKRIRLGLEDRDVSAAVVALFRSGQIFVPNGKDAGQGSAGQEPVGREQAGKGPDGERFAGRTGGLSFLWFSASEKSFSGWDKPHSCFIRGTGSSRDTDGIVFRPSSPPGEDRFLAEKSWWLDFFQASAGFETARGPDGSFPKRLFSIQKNGFENWSDILLKSENGGFSYLEGKAAGETTEMLRKRVAERKTVKENTPENVSGKPVVSVSATDMTDFFSCPVFWLYRHIFDLEEYPIDAAMLDDVSLGNIHHKILQSLFEKIKKEDKIFDAARLDQYCAWAGELSRFVFRSDRDFKGLLAYPLLEPLAEAMTRRICSLLRTEARYFSGFAVDALEEKFAFVSGSIRFTGTIDRVSLYPAADAQSSGDALIVDYKTGKSPPQKDCVLSGGVLKNFQMPMYIMLYEEKTSRKAGGGYFFSINKNEIKEIVGALPRKKGVSREKYQETLDSLDEYSDRFREALQELDFSPETVPFHKCVSCLYRTVCRSVYALNPALKKTRGYYLLEKGNEEKDNASLS